ncbi:MAG: Rha family transcriptional regulator [Burkholderiales bacterium]|nr:Rha family transcriptional regulator [Burkholderiales bacterium]MDR4515860.1 Rha family transcriptional regulator [Nitrosomonas sp.]
MEKIVSAANNKVVTSTRIIAKHFGRNHNEIVHALRYLMSDCGAAFSEENFFTQEQNNSYWVTSAGFMVLSGLFLGARNARIKITFIDAFNKAQREMNTNMLIRNEYFPVSSLEKYPSALAG